MARPRKPESDTLLPKHDNLLAGVEHQLHRRELEAMLFGTPLEPTMIGRYRLDAQLGKGGMGSVFAATDERGQPVAIKLMHARSSSTARFEREIGVLANLEHPRIVRYIDHGTSEDGRIYLVMERLEGEDLASYLRRTRPSVAECVQLGVGVADALVRVHELGCVHRDIKPGNLFLPAGHMDQVKLVDFGLARARDLMPKLTNSNMVLGTVGYMSPEQARGHSNIDHRTDIFSLGCVLFEALTGSHPFADENPMRVVTRILMDEPVELASLQPQVPARLARLIHAMLAKPREQRPTSSGELLAELRACQPQRSL